MGGSRNPSQNAGSEELSTDSASRTRVAGSDQAQTWINVMEGQRLKGQNIAPVWTFPHAPLACCWTKVAESNIIVEKRLNPFVASDALFEGCTEDLENAHWLAKVVSYSGYLAKIAYERFEGDDPSNSTQSDVHYDGWAHFCTEIHRVGYCASNKFPVIPTQLAMGSYNRISANAWRSWFLKKVTGVASKNLLVQNLLDNHFKDQMKVGTLVEALDINNASRMKVGKVKKVIGHRINVKYWDADKMGRNSVKSFWTYQSSDLIYPAGWSRAVGQELRAPPSYNPPVLPPTHSSLSIGSELNDIDVQVGMKFETINPREPSLISAATVVKVLKHGYFMCRIDGIGSNSSKSRSINSWFCYHVTSPVIFPCGFCKTHKIDLVPPSRESRISPVNQYQQFNWSTYFEKTGSKPLPLEQIPKKEFAHGFVQGAKLEAVDLRAPHLICVATVSRVVGSLLRIHFDAWNEVYDEWVPVTSTDIYPVGYCQLVNHPLQKPPIAISSHSSRRSTSNDQNR